ncbi:MAG: hypothetical protein ACM3X3_05220 [Betaproteobacteria bacterium]
MARKRGNNAVSYLHVYGQEQWHDDVQIIGNKRALQALRDAVNAVLQEHKEEASMDTVFTGDGEGYRVTVIRLDDERTWPTLAVPYTDEFARETREGAVWPDRIGWLDVGG